MCYFSALITDGVRGKDTPTAHPVPRSWSLILFPHYKNQGPSKKWMIPGLGTLGTRDKPEILYKKVRRYFFKTGGEGSWERKAGVHRGPESARRAPMDHI